MKTVLFVQGLNAHYGAAKALFNLSFDLAAGQALVLQGANGAGKSTTLKALMGLVQRSAQRVDLLGTSILNLTPDAIANLGVGYVPEDRRIFTRLTVLENLQLAHRQVENNRWHLDVVLDALPHLKGLLARKGDAVSGGEQRMLAVGRALMRSPTLLLLDEPCEGVAPKVADAIANALNIALQQGVAVVLSESHDGFAQRLGAKALKLHAGHCV